MKNRFTLVDVIASVTELKKLKGMRVNNVYDIDNKTYLIKMGRTDEKAVILFESGVRLHQTFHDWPKSQMPSSFSMKLRKHINQKRLTDIRVVGFDRLVELTFGSEDRENKLIIELYDRGNVVLTDGDYTILNILRVRTDKDTSVRWAVKEKYTFSAESEQRNREFTIEDFEKSIESIEEGRTEQLLRILSNLTKCGNPVTKEIMHRCGIKVDAKVNSKSEYLEVAKEKLNEFREITQEVWKMVEENPEGHISYDESKSVVDGSICEVYKDYNPIPMKSAKLSKKLSSFCESVDEYYSRIETQKQEQKAMNVEKQALKKLENVEKDQKGRIEALVIAQDEREKMANLIILNNDLVERALLLIRTALANQISWATIDEMRKTAAANGDLVARSIVSLKFENNEFVMALGDPYDSEAECVKVPIDISLNASKNAQRFFVDKKSAAEKVKKTIASSGKAIKNAQEKAKTTLEQVRVVAEVKKSRKAMWFEKFRWFISSEGYVVVAGRDAQQNEMLVKKYLRNDDIYLHADVRGACSAVIRNKPGGGEIPPKTLTEASQFAVCYSNAWEANVTASAWWVRKEQVSRTAPTGEYLPSGSFMIRGKKNIMPPSQLVMGLGIMFKLDDESLENHRIVEKERSAEEEKKDERAEKEERNEEIEEFPDVQINIGRTSVEEEEMTLIEIGAKTPQIHKLDTKENTQQYLEEKQKQELAAAQQISARTQKRKMRKEKIAKQKYKDLTEDDLELHRELLKPQGEKPKTMEEQKIAEQNKPKEVMRKEIPKREPANGEDEEEMEDDKDLLIEEEGLLATLTNSPFDNDTLLFAVPVVAPYSALTGFKYKVKITPGTGKRGKATKSAIELFTRQRTDRQSALIKSLLSDDSASRNLPTKVRVSAPQLHAK